MITSQINTAPKRDDAFQFSPDCLITSQINTAPKHETWDIKRITSSNPNKIAQAIFKKERQGPNYVIDLSLSDMSEDDALTKCASIIDDDRVDKIALIVSKKLLVMKK